jgi:hypothetical protein
LAPAIAFDPFATVERQFLNRRVCRKANFGGMEMPLAAPSKADTLLLAALGNWRQNGASLGPCLTIDLNLMR